MERALRSRIVARRARPLVVCAALAVAAAPAAGATTSGTLALEQGEPGSALALDYSWTGAPLLTGPAATRRLGTSIPIRSSAARYVPVTLTRVSSPPGVILPPSGCAGAGGQPVGQAIAVADPRALVDVEAVELDVLRRRGTARVGVARVGDGPIAVGEYPAPGLLSVETRGCADSGGAPVPGPDGGSFHDLRTVRAQAVAGDERLLGPWAAEALERRDVPLRLRDGAWRGSLRVAEADAGRYGPATRARLTIALRGAPASLSAHCRIPRALLWPSATVRNGAAALRLLRRAGFRRARYAGARPGVAAGLRGRYAVIDYGSASLPCGLPVKLRYGTG